MQALPVRLVPGDDLRASLERIVRDRALTAAFVVQGIGSLSVAMLRFAGADQPSRIDGDLEILTLAGSIADNGSHFHMSVADANGRVIGGHVAPGCIVRTTAEILIASVPNVSLTREFDPSTGFLELLVTVRKEP